MTAITAALVIVSFAFAPSARAQGPRCGAGVDLVVQALEKMRADSTSDELLDADQLLKRAAELCGELGDAWYYRSLVERKLGHAALADFAMRQAQKFPSDASSEQSNPFVLSTPVPRFARRHRPGRDRTRSQLRASRPALGARHRHWHLRRPPYSGAQVHRQRCAELPGRACSIPRSATSRPTTCIACSTIRPPPYNIKMQLNWLARSAGPDDVVVVYVATHGSSRDLDTVGVNYIITHDTDHRPQYRSRLALRHCAAHGRHRQRHRHAR